MCLIVDLQPHVSFPTSQLERACDINKHGYGIAYLEKGRVKTIRSLKQPNDPQEVADHLKRLEKKRVWLHLRHATVGKVSEENNHPLVVLTKEKDGRDLLFMHNGTLWDFDPKAFNKDLSDSAWFCESFVRPLALRFAAWMPDRSFLADDMFQRLISKYINLDSKMVFFDNMGGTLHVNRPRGKEFTGYWTSNEYSFDKNHQRSSDRTSYGSHGQNYGGHYSNYGSAATGPRITQHNSAFRQQMQRIANTPELPWEKETELILGSAPTNTPGLFVISDNTHRPDRARVRFEFREARALIDSSVQKGTSIMTDGAITTTLLTNRSSFVELTGIQKLEDVGRLSRMQLIELCDNFPNAAAELVIDLLAEVLKKNKREAIQAVANV